MSVHRARPRTALAAVLVGAVVVGCLFCRSEAADE